MHNLRFQNLTEQKMFFVATLACQVNCDLLPTTAATPLSQANCLFNIPSQLKVLLACQKTFKE